MGVGRGVKASDEGQETRNGKSHRNRALPVVHRRWGIAGQRVVGQSARRPFYLVYSVGSAGSPSKRSSKRSSSSAGVSRSSRSSSSSSRSSNGEASLSGAG